MRALNFRRAHPELFQEGDYLPLMSRGKRNRHMVAFARRRGEAWVLAVVPRLCSQLAASAQLPLGPAVWGKEGLPLPPGAPGVWENVFTRATLRVSPGGAAPALPLAEVFRHLPVALLAGIATPPPAP
jgi:(1->4)-alpha-D-glucan 1-alpha-D-glucosylmutase